MFLTKFQENIVAIPKPGFENYLSKMKLSKKIIRPAKEKKHPRAPLPNADAANA